MPEPSPVGVVLGSHMPPERIVHTARRAEELGFGELWFSEDCFFAGAFAGIAAALAETQRVPVGLGIASAVTRHPALLAMECATLSRLHPGRFRPGIGLGVPFWLQQMGLVPRSPLGAVRECVESLRRLFAGEELTSEGLFTFDRVATYVLYSVDADGRAAREAVREATAFYLTAMPDNALSEVYGIQPQLQELLAAGTIAQEMPPAWLEDLAVAGDPDEVAAKISALLDAGSDSVCLWLFPLDRADEVLELTAREVLPRL